MIIKRLLGYFITGLAILLPIGLTAYFVYRVVVAVDSLFDFDFQLLGAFGPGSVGSADGGNQL